jgi:ribonuclease P protein component
VWRSLNSKDVAAVLAAPVRARSAHFVLHHLAARPSSTVRPAQKPVVPNLFTEPAPTGDTSVDKTVPLDQWCLGLVVPKRHAKRAVTRTLLKREMRAQAADKGRELPPGLWVVRLRASFDRREFPSAASVALCAAARRELGQLFATGLAA